jgi:hypothetical protein
MHTQATHAKGQRTHLQSAYFGFSSCVPDVHFTISASGVKQALLPPSRKRSVGKCTSSRQQVCSAQSHLVYRDAIGFSWAFLVPECVKEGVVLSYRLLTVDLHYRTRYLCPNRSHLEKLNGKEHTPSATGLSEHLPVPALDLLLTSTEEAAHAQ